MSAQAMLWTAAGAALALAVLATAADWLRERRRNLDDVGWVPWQLIQILAFLLAIALSALALRG